MKKPRNINWCEFTGKIADNPKAIISEHLPDKKMLTVFEDLLMRKHINQDKCPTCNANLDRIERENPRPKPQIGDDLKNEN